MEALNDTLTITTDNSCDNLYHCRSLFQLVWSCVSVIIACTWVSVHPNVPAADAGFWRISGEKIGLMIVTLIAPEVVVLWAARQWFAARKLAADHRDKGWTVSHGFFVLMGGFARYRGDRLVCVLTYNGLNSREKEFVSGMLEREIKDRSHRDGLGKLIAVWQTTWFIVQLLARLAQRLPITELEIMTVAFAAMNVLVYFFWWNKPLGVSCHIRIQDESAAAPEPQIDQMTLFPDEMDQRKQVQQTVISIVKNVSEYLCESWGDFLSDYSTEWDTIRIAGIVLISPFWLPIYLFKILIFAKDTGSGDKIPSFVRTPHLEPLKQQDQYIAYGAAILFGAIHCAAWTFAFPSAVERVCWRIASVIVTCVPLYMIFAVWNHMRRHSFESESTVHYIGLVVSIAYVLARLALIVLPLLALQDLPPLAFETVEWISFVPHI
ncbi:hypothetical protein GYMLUDRAFT_166351 [Collybiopsis luxurians FD-317 M1]|uniref:Uncharacterized protein n=1 Tax=Collybiopsis luxurians FD-317 M1 TaxID=944289 RepID=A0A0D0CYP8_9AGAR|nr:hypothetical protein GYMLUDRAFT_166351 [Collybiopsis luxurians FD-317 M1]